jgi:lipopolysaccharide transport system ATP-binding protein
MIRMQRVGKQYQVEGKPFWAVRDLDLEVESAQTLGIIGSNGSGKSTLLKLLARVTPPTKGTIVYEGRVGALLEVGTGFHHELTGRENIFLSGAILGMGKKEVRRHFDAIVAFSEIEDFLDTPVKRYSSGMFLRLGFAIMAHLKSEILIIDEILAVGDQEFQEKCFAKMREVAFEGRTILFVSHNLQKIEEISDRIVLMEGGRLNAYQTALQ